MMLQALVQFMERPTFNALAPYATLEENRGVLGLAVREVVTKALRHYSFEQPLAGVPTVSDEAELYQVILQIGALSHQEGYLVPHQFYYWADLPDIRTTVAWQQLHAAAANFGVEPVFDRQDKVAFFGGREYLLGAVKFALVGRPQQRWGGAP